MFPAVSEANPELTTMPRVFKDAGYQTVQVGKFLHRDGDAPDAWTRESWKPENMPHYAAPENRHKSGQHRQRGPLFEAIDVPDAVYTDGQIADRAIEELGRLQQEPFFLAVGFVRPHLPFNCPKRYWDLYDADRIEVPALDGMRGVASHQLHGNYELASYGGSSLIQPRRMIHGYRACVSYVDAQIGRLLDELANLQLAERTIVVLWGDHGWHLGEHGVWGKFTLLEPSLRVPLILRVPGFAGERSTRALVESVDILPTLCELTGLPTPAQVQGVSFVPLLRDPTRSWKRAVFGSRRWTQQFPVAGMTVRTDRYRFVRWRRDDGTGESELYDHASDPAEYVNLAGEEQHQARIAQLNSMMPGCAASRWAILDEG
jgi:arylsulfatase A-like enzyme